MAGKNGGLPKIVLEKERRMRQATLDQFFARKSKPPDDPCSREEKNPLKRKAEEPKKERRKTAKPNAAMTHAPWWDART